MPRKYLQSFHEAPYLPSSSNFQFFLRPDPFPSPVAATVAAVVPLRPFRDPLVSYLDQNITLYYYS